MFMNALGKFKIPNEEGGIIKIIPYGGVTVYVIMNNDDRTGKVSFLKYYSSLLIRDLYDTFPVCSSSFIIIHCDTLVRDYFDFSSL